eukprot:GHVP01000838.1.p1 GENE.GHVP01000838.1~~GHVP01000838.1.p1  ORF type:complete len:1405 (-),score=274.46 GHVP01000838.1:2248-6462(-)
MTKNSFYCSSFARAQILRQIHIRETSFSKTFFLFKNSVADFYSAGSFFSVSRKKAHISLSMTDCLSFECRSDHNNSSSFTRLPTTLLEEHLAHRGLEIRNRTQRKRLSGTSQLGGELSQFANTSSFIRSLERESATKQDVSDEESLPSSDEERSLAWRCVTIKTASILTPRFMNVILNTNLLDLRVTGVRLHGRDLSTVCSLICQLEALKSLTLENLHLNTSSFEQILEAADECNLFSHLNHFDIRNNELKNCDLESLREFVEDSQSLKSLSIGGNEWEPAELQKWDVSRRLTHLGLDGMNLRRANFSFLNSFKDLTSLSLDASNLNSASILSFPFKNQTSLVELNLSHNLIGSSIRHMTSILQNDSMKGIHTLELRDVGMNSSHTSILFEVLLSHDSRVKYVDVSENRVIRKKGVLNIDTKAKESFAFMTKNEMKCNLSLKYLIMENIGASAGDVGNLIMALLEHSFLTLRYLNIRQEGTSSESDREHLANILVSYSNHKSFHSLEDVHGITLKSCQDLSNIDFSSNAEILKHLKETNPCLEEENTARSQNRDVEHIAISSPEISDSDNSILDSGEKRGKYISDNFNLVSLQSDHKLSFILKNDANFSFSLLHSSFGFLMPNIPAESTIISLLKGPDYHVLFALKQIFQKRVSVGFQEFILLQEMNNSSHSPKLQYFLELCIEMISLSSLTLKFNQINLLDFDDRLTEIGVVFYDGGPETTATNGKEFRTLWIKRHSDLAAEFPEFVQSINEFVEPFISNPACAGNENSDDRNTASPSVACGECECREVVVVDIGVDSNLRDLISKAKVIYSNSPTPRKFVSDLRKFVSTSIKFRPGETEGSLPLEIRSQARQNFGFILLGDIKIGISRHKAFLFKVLCDSVGVPCRLVRNPSIIDEPCYNFVLVDPSVWRQMTALPHVEENDENQIENVLRVSWDTDKDKKSDLRKTNKSKRAAESVKIIQQAELENTKIRLDAVFEFVDQIGKGSFGEVWKVSLKSQISDLQAEVSKDQPIIVESMVNPNSIHLPEVTPRKKTSICEKPEEKAPRFYALKLVPWEEDNVPEAEMLRNYSHPRIVQFLGVFIGYQVMLDRRKQEKKQYSLCFLMDLADGSLESLLEKRKRSPESRLTESSVRILLDVAMAMAYLHHPSPTKPYLIHRDLKPENILLKTTERGVLRALLSDFGIAKIYEAWDVEITQGPGTEGYIAPEQRSSVYDRPADVWSFGVVMARLLGVSSWKELTHRPPRKDEFALGDRILSELCFECLEARPMMRPTFKDVVAKLSEWIFSVKFQEFVFDILPDPSLPLENYPFLPTLMTQPSDKSVSHNTTERSEKERRAPKSRQKKAVTKFNRTRQPNHNSHSSGSNNSQSDDSDKSTSSVQSRPKRRQAAKPKPTVKVTRRKQK